VAKPPSGQQESIVSDAGNLAFCVDLRVRASTLSIGRDVTTSRFAKVDLAANFSHHHHVDIGDNLRFERRKVTQCGKRSDRMKTPSRS
jgi:hypothetical protein